MLTEIKNQFHGTCRNVQITAYLRIVWLTARVNAVFALHNTSIEGYAPSAGITAWVRIRIPQKEHTYTEANQPIRGLQTKSQAVAIKSEKCWTRTKSIKFTRLLMTIRIFARR